MGWRVRRSIKILPGIRMNVGSRGVSSFSFGGRGMTVNVNKRGTRTTFSLPGTGISYRTSRSTQRRVAIGQPSSNPSPRVPMSPVRKKVIAVYALVGVLALFTYNALKPNSPTITASATLPAPQGASETPQRSAQPLPLSAIITPAAAAPARSIQAENSGAGKMVTTTTGANVRSQPTRTASISTVLDKGTNILVVETEGVWSHVTDQGGKMLGWVHNSILK